MLIDRRYETIKELGRGGAGVVYLASDRLSGMSSLAIKTVRGASIAPGFESEFSTLALLRHPNLARVYDFGRDREHDLLYFTSDFVEGQPLDWAKTGRPFEWLAARTIEICRALDYIHRHDVLHCDVKPENLLVDRRDDRVRLLDFGFAMTRAADNGSTARGTLAYVAPEWLRGGLPDARSDLYSLGMVLYRITTGRFPFDPHSQDEVIRFHLGADLNWPILPSDVPAWWSAIVNRLLARQPEQRYPSAAAVVRDMNRRSGRNDSIETGEALKAALRGGVWIERDGILGQCHGYIASAMAEVTDTSAPLLVWLTGEQGSGKSRLLEELRRGLQLAGRTVVALGGFAPGGQNLAHLLQTVCPNVAGTAAADAAPNLAAEGVDTRRLQVERLGEALLKAANPDGLVLLIDDAQDLDETNVRAISFALHAIDYARSRQPADAPTTTRLIVFAALPLTAETDSHWSLLAGQRFRHHVRLAPLDRAGVDALLAAVLGERPLPEGLRQELETLGAGNPGFLLALLDGLHAQGWLRLTAEGVAYAPERAGTGNLPTSLEKSLLRIVETLDADECRLLEFACLAHGPLPLSVCSMAAAVPTAAVEKRWCILAERGLLRLEGGGAQPTAAPTNPTLRVAVQKRLSADVRQKMHADLFEAHRLAAFPDRAGAAHHAFVSGQWHAGRQLALDAAEQARNDGRFEAALALIDLAKSMAPEDPGVWLAAAVHEVEIRALLGDLSTALSVARQACTRAGADSDLRLLAAWRLRVAELLVMKGEHSQVQAIVQPLLDAPDASSEGGYRTAALAWLARAALMQGEYESARQLGKSVLAQAQNGDVRLWHARAHNTLGLVEYFCGDLTTAKSHLGQAADLFASLNQSRELAYAVNSLALVHHRLGDYGQAVAQYRRSLELAQLVGDQQRETIVRMNLSVVHQQTGAYREAIDNYLAALERAYRVQDLPSLVKIYNNLGNLHRFLGRLDEAEAYIARSMDLSDRLEDRRIRALNRLILGEIHLFRGELEAAERRIREADTLFSQMELVGEGLEAQLDMVELLRQHHRETEALDIAQSVSRRALDAGLSDHRCRAELERATLWLQCDNADPVQSVQAALQALSLVEGQATPELGWRLHASLAMGYERLGHELAARQHLERAGKCQTALEQTLPVEFRSAFFERPDRRERRRELESLQSRLPDPATSSAGNRDDRSHEPDRAALLKLLDINKRLISEVQLDRLLNMIMDAVIDLSGAERGFIILREGDRLRIPAARNIDRETIRKSALKISHSIAAKVIDTGEPIVTYDAMEDERYRDFVSIHALKLRSVLCMPLKEREQTFGAIYLDNRFQASAFEPKHKSLIEAFADQAAVALTNARLHERNRRIQLELQQSRDEVERLNQELQQKLLDQSAKLSEAREALQRHQSELEQRYRYGNLIGSSESMRRVYALIERVKDLDVPVIIQGDSGTGKELVARAIHFNGSRCKREFVSMNCAAFPETLLESELFGYKRGAFTGADRDKKGLFLVAHTGTLFLDEVGDMSLGMQAKLLRALQENEIRPIGSHESIHVDVRIIAASNKDLKELIAKGLFREDLFYRLNVVTIWIPPLRQRKEDILILLDHFIARIAKQTATAPKTLSAEARKVLLNYPWPGNVRELEATITTASLFSSGSEIGLADLSNKPELIETHRSVTTQDLGDGTLADLEREAIVQSLIRCNGNKVAAARALGISRRSLYNKLKEHTIELSKKTTVLR